MLSDDSRLWQTDSYSSPVDFVENYTVTVALDTYPWVYVVVLRCVLYCTYTELSVVYFSRQPVFVRISLGTLQQ